MITKQEVLNYLDNVLHPIVSPDNYNIYSELYDMIEDLPSSEHQWIPVSERLPETTDEVLTTYIVNDNKKKRFVQTSTYYDNEEEGYWSSPWDEYLVPNTKIEVLAWKPLPNPYKEDKE